MTDVTALRAAARRRAAARPRVPFTGEIIDGITAGVGCRTYVPHHASPHVTAYFLHGGYGILGDLDLQDGYCRQVATELRCRTISVEYALAPEHTFDAAVTDLATLVHEERPEGFVLLCGDSAGGAVATAAALRLGSRVDALMLTNPNLDLSLGLFDHRAPQGPDHPTLVDAFTSWLGPEASDRAPRLHERGRDLPPTFIAVGSEDALMPEAQALVAAAPRNGLPHRLLVLNGLGHGFVADHHAGAQVAARARAFLDELHPG